MWYNISLSHTLRNTVRNNAPSRQQQTNRNLCFPLRTKMMQSTAGGGGTDEDTAGVGGGGRWCGENGGKSGSGSLGNGSIMACRLPNNKQLMYSQQQYTIKTRHLPFHFIKEPPNIKNTLYCTIFITTKIHNIIMKIQYYLLRWKFHLLPT